MNNTLLTNLFLFLTELNSTDLKDCISENSLSSNASLPSVQSCRRLRERRVASWAVSFERLLQDPIGVKYFSDFLRKEFSEENILFGRPVNILTMYLHMIKKSFLTELGRSSASSCVAKLQPQLILTARHSWRMIFSILHIQICSRNSSFRYLT